MVANIGSKAIKPNPRLKLLEVLVGEWDTEGSHPYLPGKTLHGRTVFEWLEKGAFLMGRSEVQEPEIPDGIAIFGSDDTTNEIFMLYFDERDISRKYDVTVRRGAIGWERHSPDFSQRMMLTVSTDGNTIASKGEMSRGGGVWEPDLELTYSRIK